MILDRDGIERTDEAPEGVSRSSVFVIQKGLSGDACYDFWLEVDGALQLWSMHGGNSADEEQTKFPKQSNETIVESCNLEAFSFDDETQLGPEIVWDAGEFRCIGEDNGGIRSALEAGRIRLWLGGERLKGEYLLVRTNEEEEPTWLLLGRNGVPGENA